MTTKTLCARQPFITGVTDHYYSKQADQQGVGLFYTYHAAGEQTESFVLPDDSLDLMFYCNEDGSDPHMGVYGQRTAPGKLAFAQPGCRYFGVRFTPGTRPALLDLSLAETRELELAHGEEFLKDRSLVERILTEADFDRQQAVFLETYLKYRDGERPSTQSELFRFLQRAIVLSRGSVTVDALVEQSGYSPRYVKQVFTQRAGVGPKLFARIVRFQQLVFALNNSVLRHDKADFSRMAGDLEFTDQSHMIREMRALSGYAPTEYIKQLKNTNYEKRLVRL